MLDLLGDVGGFIDCLLYIGTLLVWVVSGNRLMEYMSTRLFEIEAKLKARSAGAEQAAHERINKRKRLRESCCPSPLCFL